MNLRNMIDVLSIVAKHCSDTSYCSAEHDVLITPLLNETEIPAKDAKQLERLGAFMSEEFGHWSIFV